VTVPAEQSGFVLSDGTALPAPGELGIKQKRAWKTWQLLVGMLFALVVGMLIDYVVGGGQGTANSSASAPAYQIPTSSGSATTTTLAGASGSGGSTTTSAAGGSTTTTQAGGSTTTTSAPPSSGAPAGPARVLVGPTQMQGNWTSPAFTTTAAGWNIGWAFRCVPAPASGASFQVFVTTPGATPSGTPAVSETGASGQSVASQSSLGAQTLVVEAPATCTWVVKVTGS
jgi:hypothetical protein